METKDLRVNNLAIYKAADGDGCGIEFIIATDIVAAIEIFHTQHGYYPEYCSIIENSVDSVLADPVIKDFVEVNMPKKRV
jgi:hypothetical protein